MRHRLMAANDPEQTFASRRANRAQIEWKMPFVSRLDAVKCARPVQLRCPCLRTEEGRLGHLAARSAPIRSTAHLV